MYRSIVILLVSCVVLTLAGCQENEEQLAPQNFREYASIMCTVKELPDNATWGEFQERTKHVIELAERVVPPAGLFDYHFSNLAMMRVVLKIAQNKDRHAVANPYELNDEGLIAAVYIHQDAIDGLESQAYQTLSVIGCEVS